MFATPPSFLLVEDNPVDLDLTQRALRRRGMTNPIEVARDGEEALAFISSWEAGTSLPALILLDLKLPKVSGLEVLRQIKSHPRFSVIPVIILTSSSEDCDVQEAYKLGANSYIVKTVDFGKFLEVAAQIEAYSCVMNASPG